MATYTNYSIRPRQGYFKFRGSKYPIIVVSVNAGTALANGDVLSGLEAKGFPNSARGLVSLAGYRTYINNPPPYIPDSVYIGDTTRTDGAASARLLVTKNLQTNHQDFSSWTYITFSGSDRTISLGGAGYPNYYNRGSFEYATVIYDEVGDQYIPMGSLSVTPPYQTNFSAWNKYGLVNLDNSDLPYGVFDPASPDRMAQPAQWNVYIGANDKSIMAPFFGLPNGDPYEDLDIGGQDPIPGGGSIAIPGLPPLSAISTGILGLFAPTTAQMQQLADYMWTDFGGTGTSVTEVLEEIVEAIKRAISNPLDYVVGLNIIPSQGLSIGASQQIKFGFTNSGVSMPALASQYFIVDCGSLSFGALCGDTFLDYAPYSKFSIYLPYIGVKTLDANDCVGHTIGVVYHGDVVTGGVTAYVTKDGSVMYQYSGCCALNIPLSSDNWGNTISGAVQIATSLIASGATGGAAGVGIAAAKGAASVAANPSLLSPQVQHSGAVSGGAGCMGVQYPFIIREAVSFHSTASFNTLTGYPAYYFRKLGDVTGYTTVLDVHLENIAATQAEIEEIEALLKGGVIL